MTKLKQTKPSFVKLLYQLMYDIHQILNNNDIKYFVDGGTLLGAVRHGGIIPWDDDLDIGMLPSDIKKFLSIKKSFENCGYKISKVWFGYKIFYANRKLIDGFNYSYPFIDVFPYKESNGLIVPAIKAVRDEWPKAFYEKEDLFPLDLHEFGSFEIWGAREPLPYLEKMYGKDWDEVAYRQYDHENEEVVESVKVKLTDSMRKPAKPYTQIKDRQCVKVCLYPKKDKKSPTYWKIKETDRCTRSGNCYNNFDIKMGVYVINCSMHKSRYNKFKKYSAEAGVKACRVPCVLGKDFSPNLLCDMIKQRFLDKNADMTKIEISINMSHFNCWQKLLNSCTDYALIMEDDVELKPDFIQRINELMETIEDQGINLSILQLWDGNWSNSKQKEFMKVGDMTLMQQMDEYNSGAVAYIISKDYAQFLIDRFFPIEWPQDILMGTFYKQGVHLALKMKYRKKDECYLSPVLNMDCGGPGGTGAQTTQEHDRPGIGILSCKKC